MEKTEILENEKERENLPELRIGKHRSALPIIQGGMGIGISGAPLAGAVSRNGGIGTLTSAATHLTPPYRDYRLGVIRKAKKESPDGKISKENHRRLFKEANIHCVKEEIRKAKKISGGKPIFINIMVASRDYNDIVKAACEAGVDGIVSGAGVPRNLPELTKDYPDVALIPILSVERGVKTLVEYWQNQYGKTPDAIVLEDPSKAGGHLGKGKIEAVNDEDGKLENSVPAVRAYLDSIGLQHIPVIAAGGIDTREDIDAALKLGAAGVQMGTRFLASKESGANEEFKKAIISITKEYLKVILSSAGLPFRAIKTCGTLTRKGGPKDREAHTRECLRNCLIHCGFNKGIANVTQMCIVKELIRSTEGGNKNGLMSTGDFFDKDGKSKITSILSVKEIFDLLTKKAE